MHRQTSGPAHTGMVLRFVPRLSFWATVVLAVCWFAINAGSLAYRSATAAPVKAKNEAQRASNPGPTVLFNVSSPEAVPIVCFDPAKRRLVAGAPCLKLVPRKSMVAAIDGTTYPFEGRTKASCDIIGEVHAALRLGSKADYYGLAVWPADRIEGFLQTKPPSKRAQILSATRSTQLTKGLRQLNDEWVRAHRNARLRVVQSVQIGAGKRRASQWVHVVVSAAPKDPATFVLRSDNLGRHVQIVTRSSFSDARHHISLVVDLDGDGRDEIVVEELFTEGRIVQFYHNSRNALRKLGEYNCS